VKERPDWFKEKLPHAFVPLDFYAEYEIREILGESKYSTIYRCIKRSSCIAYAAKIIDKGSVVDYRFLVREIEILNSVRHPFIIRLEELYENLEELVFVMELCAMELFTFIDKKGPLSEALTKSLVRNLLEAVAYLHGMFLQVFPESLTES
jgi:serine/threonine-protein kinase CHEK2